MGLEFLARVRRTTTWLGLIAALVVSTYVSPISGLALALGAAWSLVNLALIERLIVALTGTTRGTADGLKSCVRALLGMGALFGAGALLLLRLPIPMLLAGFLAPFAVLTLKAATLILLPSGLWRRVTRDPKLATALVALVVGAVWLALPDRIPAGAQGTHGAAAPAPATHAGAADESHALGEAAKPAEEHATGGEHGEGSGPQKFANVITVLHRAYPHVSWIHFLHEYEVIVFSLVIALLLCLVAWAATRNAQLIPTGLQNLVETLVESLDNFITGILGEHHGRRFVPFLGTLFLYIWVMNLFGLIPFMESPTSSLNVTVALAVVVFLYAQWIGLRGLGVVGYVDHLMGSPRNVTGWLLVPLMLPIHILGELAKPISLSCRLFGNVFGEDMLLVAFVSLGITVGALVHSPVGVPLQLPFLLLALLTSTLQALVFTVLSTIYFLLMLPHEDHGHEGHEAHAHVDVAGEAEAEMPHSP